MSRFWKIFSRPQGEKNYDFSKLIDAAHYDASDGAKFPIQYICDIDKTYLETQFESLLKMARVALESAEAKITVAGAADVLMALRWGANKDDTAQAGLPRPIHFVSSSPPQLRPVLEEKLCIDGLDWTSDTFKNQAYNVIKGRVDQLKQHVGYKSAAILRLIQSAGDGVRYILFGDNAESDAFIYLGVTLRLLNRLSPEGYASYLVAAGLEPRVAKDVAMAFKDLPSASIDAIYIRNAPGYHFIEMPDLTKGVTLFDDYFQLTTMLCLMDLIPPDCLADLTRTFHNRNGFSRKRLSEHLAVLLQEEPNPSLAGATRKAFDVLQVSPASVKVNACFLLRDISYLKTLEEKDILAFARTWSDAMKKDKQERRGR